MVSLRTAAGSGAIARATEAELTKRGVVGSALGQAALLAARCLDNVGSGETGSGVKALLEAHRFALTEAIRGATSSRPDPLEVIRASAALKLVGNGGA